MVILDIHGVLISPSAAIAGIQDMLNSLYIDFNVNIYTYLIYGFVSY